MRRATGGEPAKMAVVVASSTTNCRWTLKPTREGMGNRPTLPDASPLASRVPGCGKKKKETAHWLGPSSFLACIVAARVVLPGVYNNVAYSLVRLLKGLPITLKVTGKTKTLWRLTMQLYPLAVVAGINHLSGLNGARRMKQKRTE